MRIGRPTPPHDWACCIIKEATLLHKPEFFYQTSGLDFPWGHNRTVEDIKTGAPERSFKLDFYQDAGVRGLRLVIHQTGGPGLMPRDVEEAFEGPDSRFPDCITSIVFYHQGRNTPDTFIVHQGSDGHDGSLTWNRPPSGGGFGGAIAVIEGMERAAAFPPPTDAEDLLRRCGF